MRKSCSLAAVLLATVMTVTGCHSDNEQATSRSGMQPDALRLHDIDEYNTAIGGRTRQLQVVLMDVWESLRIRAEEGNEWSENIAKRYLDSKHHYQCQNQECEQQWGIYNAWREKVTFPAFVAPQSRRYNGNFDVPLQLTNLLADVPFHDDAYFRYNPDKDPNKTELLARAQNLIDKLISFQTVVHQGLNFDLSKVKSDWQPLMKTMNLELEFENTQTIAALHYLAVIKEYIEALPV